MTSPIKHIHRESPVKSLKRFQAEAGPPEGTQAAGGNAPALSTLQKLRQGWGCKVSYEAPKAPPPKKAKPVVRVQTPRSLRAARLKQKNLLMDNKVDIVRQNHTIRIVLISVSCEGCTDGLRHLDAMLGSVPDEELEGESVPRMRRHRGCACALLRWSDVWLLRISA